MRICIVAEHASTRFGGEAILPVHYFRLLRSRGLATWLVVHSRTRKELEELFPHDLDRIRFIPDAWLQKVSFRLSTFLPRRLAEATCGVFNQAVTQLRQRKVVRELIRTEKIDIIHQPIPVAPRVPSLLFGLGVPRVVGPLNGGMDYPPFLKSGESTITSALVSIARRFSDLSNTIFPGKKHADVVLVANQRTRRALPTGTSGRIIELPENGVDLEVWREPDGQIPVTIPRFVFVGRLVDWKAVDIVIQALKDCPGLTLEVIGDGPMLEPWRTMAAQLGAAKRIQFTGWLSQSECAARILTATALVLPSIYECGGAVVLEAMAMGKPVIASNWGGPADYLDASCGILVEPASRDALVKGFADAMQLLADSPAIARSMGAAGRERVVREFDWQKKIDRMIEIYTELAEQSVVSATSKDATMTNAPV